MDAGIERAYENLANAIVVQAAEDYKEAYYKSLTGRAGYAVKDRLKECREFFLSEWFSDLTEIDAPRMLKMIEKECERQYAMRHGRL